MKCVKKGGLEKEKEKEKFNRKKLLTNVSLQNQKTSVNGTYPLQKELCGHCKDVNICANPQDEQVQVCNL